jgi:predicted GNAT superfamily acetyltransferase
VVGYTLGYDIKKLDPDYQNVLASSSFYIRDIIFSEKVFYHRHIAKKIDKINIGKGLLHTLLERATEAGYKYIVCQIAEKPFQNKVSKALHEKFGFVCAGYNQSEEAQFGVYIKKIDTSTSCKGV